MGRRCHTTFPARHGVLAVVLALVVGMVAVGCGAPQPSTTTSTARPAVAADASAAASPLAGLPATPAPADGVAGSGGSGAVTLNGPLAGGGQPAPLATAVVAASIAAPSPVAVAVSPPVATATPKADPPSLVIPGVTARAFTVVEAGGGNALLSQRADERLPMASLTKVMTGLLTLQHARMDDIADVPEAVAQLGRASTRMGISPGERLSVRDLLYGLMLPSGNDAAIALAQHVSGSETAFVGLMNQQAAALGLHDTRFANPHGLDSRAGDHYSSAADLVRLARVAFENAEFRTIMAARNWTAVGEQQTYHLSNGNLLLSSYPGADGMKTGYTRGAGQTMIGTAERNGRRLFVAVLGSTQRFADAAILLDRGFRMLAGQPPAAAR